QKQRRISRILPYRRKFSSHHSGRREGASGHHRVSEGKGEIGQVTAVPVRYALKPSFPVLALGMRATHETAPSACAAYFHLECGCAVYWPCESADSRHAVRTTRQGFVRRRNSR